MSLKKAQKKISKKQIENEDVRKERVANKIDNEGLEYWLTDYYDPEDIPEEDVRKACEKARKWLQRADELLTEYGYMW